MCSNDKNLVTKACVNDIKAFTIHMLCENIELPINGNIFPKKLAFLNNQPASFHESTRQPLFSEPRHQSFHESPPPLPYPYGNSTCNRPVAESTPQHQFGKESYHHHHFGKLLFHVLFTEGF